MSENKSLLEDFFDGREDGFAGRAVCRVCQLVQLKDTKRANQHRTSTTLPKKVYGFCVWAHCFEIWFTHLKEDWNLHPLPLHQK